MNVDRKRQPSLESRLALFWLHRLGIVTLVLGVVFLITYSMHTLSPEFAWLLPWLKLGTGFAVSTALLWLGEKLTGRDDQKWFGQALTAGGWSLAYFSTYAAHYIPSVNVIESLPVETALLTLVAAGALYSALKARSELMAIYSITLAAGTILINGPSLYSDVSFLIIAIAAAILGNTQSWRKLFAFALAACYIGHFYCSLSITPNHNERLILAAFLSSLWMVFSVAIGFSLSIPAQARNLVTGLACANAMLFAVGLSATTDKSVELIYQTIFVAFGLLYLATSYWLRSRDQAQLSTVHALLGLSFINAAKLMHYSGLTLLTIDVVQIALLTIVAIRYDIKAFRYTAAALTMAFILFWISGASRHQEQVIIGIHAIEYFRIAALGAGVFAILSLLHLRTEGKNFYFNFYYFVSNIVAVLAIFNIDDLSWRAFAFALIALTNYVCGLRNKDDYYVDVAFLLLAICSTQVLFACLQWNTLAIALTTATFYGGYIYSRKWEELDRSHLVQLFHDLLGYAGTLTLTALILAKAPSDYCSTQLALEAIVLLVVGLSTKDSFLRRSGLVVLAVLTGKLLFFDLANHNTFERILSFIAAGVIFLLASYLYSRFSNTFDEAETESESFSEGAGAGTADVNQEGPYDRLLREF
ncbi:MAG: DUF2339 domain-containing protein [Candidatus Obscuribacterales bacterium]